MPMKPVRRKRKPEAKTWSGESQGRTAGGTFEKAALGRPEPAAFGPEPVCAALSGATGR